MTRTPRSSRRRPAICLASLSEMDVMCGGIYMYDPPKQSESEQAAVLVSSGSEQSGMRPFVIVSRDLVNKNKNTAVGVPMSTRIHKANSYRVLLPAGELIREGWSTFQFQDSVALCDHVRVLDTTRIKEHIGPRGSPKTGQSGSPENR